MTIKLESVVAAVTGVIGFPRFDTDAERRVAKTHPDHRVSRDSMISVADTIAKTATALSDAARAVVQQQSMALHEIRKLNGKVKQSAERLCSLERPDRPEAANPALVNIWKAAELMSRQFEVLELLANEALTTLPLNSRSEPFKMFDKCARIYRTPESPISLESPGEYRPVVRACDKTFPIIASVLIENAMKYSTADGDIRIVIEPAATPGVMSVRVSNNALLTNPLSPAVFDKGQRATTDKEGSGNGLYVAQLVAKQHGSIISVSAVPNAPGKARVTFAMKMATV